MAARVLTVPCLDRNPWSQVRCGRFGRQGSNRTGQKLNHGRTRMDTDEGR
jgi:hypothetical protein